MEGVDEEILCRVVWTLPASGGLKGGVPMAPASLCPPAPELLVGPPTDQKEGAKVLWSVGFPGQRVGQGLGLESKQEKQPVTNAQEPRPPQTQTSPVGSLPVSPRPICPPPANVS